MSKRDRETEVPRDEEGGREGQGRRRGPPTTFRGPHTDRSSRIYGESERAGALAKPKTELSPSLVNPGLENTGNVAVVTPFPTALLSSSSGGRKASAKFENRSTPGTTERNHSRSRERLLRLATPRISRPFKAQITRVNSLYYRRLEANVLRNIVLLVCAQEIELALSSTPPAPFRSNFPLTVRENTRMPV